MEDDEKLNRIVCTYLNDSGFQAKGCLNARDAYDEMYSQLYDLIISDIMMPEIDGFEFARSVRKVNERIPILFMSAKDDLPSKQRGFRLGIDDYMVKPFLRVSPSFSLAMHVDTDEANAFANEENPTGVILKLFNGHTYSLQNWADELQSGINR